MDKEEAIKILRELHDKVLFSERTALETLHPELKETEAECVEKIKKDIISYLNNRQITSIAESNATARWLSWLEKQGVQEFAEKVESKFKVKYAGNEYNVLDVKENMGITWYGIEDEPNHIDYVKANNCEIINVYDIKENGSPYPTKPAIFAGHKPTDEAMKEALRTEYEKGRADVIADTISWLANCWPQYCNNPTIIDGFKEAMEE